MTKPLFEPSTPRDIASNSYRTRNLEHRPAMGGALGLQWGDNFDDGNLGLLLQTTQDYDIRVVDDPVPFVLSELGMTTTTAQLTGPTAILSASNTSVSVAQDGTIAIESTVAKGGLRTMVGGDDNVFEVGENLAHTGADGLGFTLRFTAAPGGGSLLELVDYFNGSVLLRIDTSGNLEILGALKLVMGDITLSVGSGSLFVEDSVGNPIFQVEPDGSLHGVTGKALTFDL